MAEHNSNTALKCVRVRESSCRPMCPAAGASSRGGQRGHWGKGDREGEEEEEEKHEKGERTKRKCCRWMKNTR